MVATSSRRVSSLLSLSVVAVVVVAVTVVVSTGGEPKVHTSASRTAATDLLAGIPQHGAVLGSPTAPVTLVEYANLRSPVSRAFTLSTLPSLIDEYVRTGQLRIDLRLPPSAGQPDVPADSVRAARYALAAGKQGRMWSFAEVFYRNQQPETSSYVNTAFLRRLGAATPGLDAEAALKAQGSSAVTAALKRAAADFRAAGLNATPAFEIGRTGARLHRLQLTSLDPAQFTPEMAKLIG